MRFTVPQFIDYETPIIWLLTFKQFLYVGFGAILCFIIYFSAPFSIFVVASVIIAGVVLSFAFVKVGGRPLSTMLGGMMKFGVSPKMYIWKNKELPKVAEEITQSPAEGEMETTEEIANLATGSGRLKKLSDKVDF